jgi:hypothetical protein
VPTLLGASTAATAHHGWGRAEGEQEELRGTIREVYIGQPHPTLRVEAAAGGGSRIVELGNHRQTAALASSRAPRSLGTKLSHSATGHATKRSAA